MAIAHIVSGGARAENTTAATTASLDTTGANLLVVTAVCWAVDFHATPVTDSKSNTWVAATPLETTNNAKVRQWYVANPTVGTGHTFTVTMAGNGYPCVAMSAFSGALTASVLDAAATGLDSTSPFNSPTTATLAQADEVAVGSFVDTGTDALSAGTGWSLGYVEAGTANFQAIGHIYKILSATTGVASEFTGPNRNTAVQVATYKAAASGTAKRLLTLGAG